MKMLLGPGGKTSSDVSIDEIRDAYPWPASGRWVRAMMVMTLDGGAAGPDGLSGTISSGADREVFKAVRRLADAVLVGASTVRDEGYGGMRSGLDDADARRADAQREAATLAIVSGSARMDYDSPTFTESVHPPVLFTTPDADPELRARAAEVADVVLAPESGLTPQFLLNVLGERGLRRVVCEGGPGLLRSMVGADLVDEADITLSPTFAGTAGTPDTDGMPEIRHWRLAHLLSEDDFVMGRWIAPGRDWDGV